MVATVYLDNPVAPGSYTGQITYLEQLLGTFADSNGVIVGTPFVIGNGPLTIHIPLGSSQLLMGFNDGGYSDNNGGGVFMNISEVSPVPEAEEWAMMLLGLGMIGIVACRKKAALAA